MLSLHFLPIFFFSCLFSPFHAARSREAGQILDW